MKTKYFLFFSLIVSGVYCYLTYTHPTPTPRIAPSVHSYPTKEGKATPTPLPPLSLPTPTLTQAKGKGKATPTPVPVPRSPLSPTLTLSGKIERANKITIPKSTPIPLSTDVHTTPTLPLSTGVHYTTPTPYVNKDSVTGARRVLPLFSVRKNGTLRYNGKNTITPNQNHGRR